MDKNNFEIFIEALKEVNTSNIEVNKRKDRNHFILYIITIALFGSCLLYSIYQSYNYQGYPKTDINNTNTNTNGGNK